MILGLPVHQLHARSSLAITIVRCTSSGLIGYDSHQVDAFEQRSPI